jgi:multidrug efflux pump subunit AcrB
MNITQFAIEKKRITITFLIVIFLTGIFTYMNMPRSEDPGFIIRNALVLTYFPGASPERVEQLVTDKLEKRIQEMPELDFVSSQSKPGLSIIVLAIKESYKDMRPIWDALRRKVEATRGELPSGIRGPFVNDEFGDVYGTVIALSAEGYSYAEM